MEPQSLSSERPWGAKLFANRSGRVANAFDCAGQLIFGHAKMPRPKFNVILMLDNDFAAVRTDFTDHFFAGLAISIRKQGRVGFVPLDGLVRTLANEYCRRNAGRRSSHAGRRRDPTRLS
jgi:hypothetical protein